MWIPLLCALVYLVLSTSVLADIRIHTEKVGLYMHASFRVWGLRLCLAGSKPYGFDRRKAGRQAKRARAIWPLAANAIQTLRWGQADVRVTLGLGDAAQTAMTAGALRMGLCGLLAALGLGRVSSVCVAPDFSGRRLEAALRCIFSATPGDLIFAVVRAAVKKTRREGFKWLSIPLRA